MKEIILGRENPLTIGSVRLRLYGNGIRISADSGKEGYDTFCKRGSRMRRDIFRYSGSIWALHRRRDSGRGSS